MNLRYSPVLQGIKASVKSMFSPPNSESADDEEVDRVIDTDDDGNKLYKEDIIANIHEELEKRRSARSALETQWHLNANFLVGNQYCDFNPYSREIEQLEPVYDWLERETFNQIAPLIDTRIANLKKINYRMKVNPRTNELEDYAKAETSTTILQYLQTSSDFDTKKNSGTNCVVIVFGYRGGTKTKARNTQPKKSLLLMKRAMRESLNKRFIKVIWSTD